MQHVQKVERCTSWLLILQSTCIHMREATKVSLFHCLRFLSFLLIIVEMEMIEWVSCSWGEKLSLQTQHKQNRHRRGEVLGISECFMVLKPRVWKGSLLHYSYRAHQSKWLPRCFRGRIPEGVAPKSDFPKVCLYLTCHPLYCSLYISLTWWGTGFCLGHLFEWVNYQCRLPRVIST